MRRDSSSEPIPSGESLAKGRIERRAIETEGKTTPGDSAAPISQRSRVALPMTGRFTQGSTLRHVLVMSLTSGIGLIAIFLVDFLSLMYVAWLGSIEKTAAVNFASIVLFFLISTNIAMMIAISAVTSKALGAGAARRGAPPGGLRAWRSAPRRGWCSPSSRFLFSTDPFRARRQRRDGGDRASAILRSFCPPTLCSPPAWAIRPCCARRPTRAAPCG